MDTPRSRLAWTLEAVSAIALAAAIGDVAIHWSLVPDRIPVHFGASGQPNGWGGKNMLLLLLGTTVVMSALLTAAEKYQWLINLPMTVDRESPAVRKLLRSMAITLKVVVTVSFFWIVDATMRTALGEANGLGQAFLPLFLGGVGVPMVYYLVRLSRL